jgi:aminoglycoside phosphotransferase (APT) family kinase protein
MGDFWPGNILLKFSPDQQQLLNIYILDWEMSMTGNPAVDVGDMCGKVDLLFSSAKEVKELGSVILSSFLDSYAHTSRNQADVHFARDVLAHWGAQLVSWAPRLPSVDKSTARALVKEGMQHLLDSQREDIVAQSAVQGMLKTPY